MFIIYFGELAYKNSIWWCQDFFRLYHAKINTQFFFYLSDLYFGIFIYFSDLDFSFKISVLKYLFVVIILKIFSDFDHMLEEVIRTLSLLSTVTEGMKRCFAYGFIFLLFFLTGSCRTSRATWWQTWCIWWWTESCWFTGSKAQEATSTKATIGRFHWHWSGHAELVYAVCWSPAGRRGTEGE